MQALRQFIEPLHAAGIGGLIRLDVDDQVQAPAQVVEHHHLVGKHEQDVRRTERIGLVDSAQARLDVAHGFVAEISDQPAVGTRQTVHMRDLETGLVGLDPGERIGDLLLLDAYPVLPLLDPVAIHLDLAPAGQTDHRVTAPLLAALHRFQQVGIRGIDQFEVGTQRRVEIGEDFADQRDARVARAGVFGELFRVHFDQLGCDGTAGERF